MRKTAGNPNKVETTRNSATGRRRRYATRRMRLKRLPLELAQILRSALPASARQSITFLNKTRDARVRLAHDDAIRAGNALAPSWWEEGAPIMCQPPPVWA